MARRTTATPQYVLDACRKDNSASNITKFKFAQAAGNFNLFDDRLVLIGAVRRDLTNLSRETRSCPAITRPVGMAAISFSNPTRRATGRRSRTFRKTPTATRRAPRFPPTLVLA